MHTVMMKRILQRSSIVLMNLLLSGCTMIYTRVDAPLTEQAVQAAGHCCHYEDLLDVLGPPSRMTALPGGFAFLYEAIVVREMQLGLSGPARADWLSLFKITIADVDLRHQSVLYHFADDGSLISASIQDADSDIGMGGAVQPLVSVAPVMDTSDYQDDGFAPMEWGLLLCRPLPVALNGSRSLRSGQAGLEQSGTSLGIGQHALEMQ